MNKKKNIVKQNIVLCDFIPNNCWDMIKGINDTSNLEFVSISEENNILGNKLLSLYRYIRYFLFAFHHFIRRTNYNYIVCWQQYYGIIFAFFCRLFRVKKTNKLIILTFIYIPKKGLLGKIKRKFVRYALDSKYVDRIVVYSHLEPEKYEKELGISKTKFSNTILGYNFDLTEDYSSKERFLLFSAGFSNRDFDFLINTLKGSKYETYIFGNKVFQCGNIHMTNELVDDRIFNKAKIVLIPLKENRESGQLTLIKAMKAGIPVITTNADCMGDYIIDGYNGYCIENVSSKWLYAIDQLMTNDRLYNQMVKNCKDIYKKEMSEYGFGQRIGKIIKEMGNVE